MNTTTRVTELLNEQEREAFDSLAEDYRASSHAMHGSRFFSPKVIALLVALGYRRDPTKVQPGRWKKLVEELAR